jgi:hypothetical protein
LLTDDLLRMEEAPEGLLAFPGPARLKLFPGIAEAFLGHSRGTRMNRRAGKLVIALDNHQYRGTPVPLLAIYSLSALRRVPGSASDHIRIEPLPLRDAFLCLAGNAFNQFVADPERLGRHFERTAGFFERVPVRRLCYPHRLDRLVSVRDAILADNVQLRRMKRPMPQELPFSSRVSVAPDVMFRVVGDESVILNLKTQLYLGLDDVGTRIWAVLKDSSSVQAAYDALLNEYDVNPGTLEKDMIDFIDRLREHGLIELTAS